jgi:hypothetical protein
MFTKISTEKGVVLADAPSFSRTLERQGDGGGARLSRIATLAIFISISNP